MPADAASDPHPLSPPALPDATALALRAVHRAAAELRRGTPVLLHGGNHLLVIAAAESLGARGLAEIAAAAEAPPLLLLAPARAAALSIPLAIPPAGEAEEAVALHLPPALLDPAALHSLADPTAERLLPANTPPERAATPALAPAALALAKLARLPPALLDPAALHSLADPTAERLLPANTPPERAATPALAPAALALAKLARLLPALVAAPAREHPRLDLLTVEAADILAYPASAAATLRRVAEAAVPLEEAPDARITAFRAADGGIEHLAILVGRPEVVAEAGGAPLLRIHSECFTGDLLGSLRCDCGPQLRGAIRRMAEAGAGVLLYLAQEGRGIGLVNKLRAYRLQDEGLDTLDANRALGWGADERKFLVAAAMLDQLGIGRVRLLTNNPAKLAALSACGIAVEGREPLAFAPNGVNDRYLATKAERFGHLLA